MTPSALGEYLLVLPDHAGGWQVAAFSASGRWQSSTVGLPTKAAAHAHRRTLLRLHGRLARERVKGKR